MNSFNTKLQIKDTESESKNKLMDLFTELKGFKFVTTLVLEFIKIQIDNKTLYSTFYLNQNEAITNESDIDDIFESIYGIKQAKIYMFRLEY